MGVGSEDGSGNAWRRSEGGMTGGRTGDGRQLEWNGIGRWAHHSGGLAGLARLGNWQKKKKKKKHKKIRQKVCMSLGCRTGEMGCASQSPRNPAPLQDAVPTAHCLLPNRQARVHNVQYSRVHVSDAFRLPSSATHPKHRAPRAAAG